MNGSQNSGIGIAGPVHRPFWPGSRAGKLGVVLFVLTFVVRWALVNVVQVPYLPWVLGVAVVGLLAAARFGRHDRSTSVLVMLVLSGLMLVLAVLFVAGEVFIGHD